MVLRPDDPRPAMHRWTLHEVVHQQRRGGELLQLGQQSALPFSSVSCCKSWRQGSKFGPVPRSTSNFSVSLVRIHASAAAPDRNA